MFVLFGCGWTYQFPWKMLVYEKSGVGLFRNYVINVQIFMTS